jgi:hypothetical protein
MEVGAPAQQTRGGPKLNALVDMCGVKTTLTVRLDFRMTVEVLKETILGMFHVYCRDEGVRFSPPSTNPWDYDVFPCNEDGSSFAPGSVGARIGALRLAKHGGDTVRNQVLNLPQPATAKFAIGVQWTERDAMLQSESTHRQLIEERRAVMLSSMQTVEAISFERALEIQHFRERHEISSSKLEDLLAYAFVAFHEYELQVEREKALLIRFCELWESEVEPLQTKGLAELEKEKRMYLSSSAIALRTLLAANISP